MYISHTHSYIWLNQSVQFEKHCVYAIYFKYNVKLKNENYILS
jgi:hypothetical protein